MEGALLALTADEHALTHDIMVDAVDRHKGLPDEAKRVLTELMAKLGYKDISGPLKTIVNLSESTLKRGLVEYLEEADHGSWEGFTHNDVQGIQAFIIDLANYLSVGDLSSVETNLDIKYGLQKLVPHESEELSSPEEEGLMSLVLTIMANHSCDEPSALRMIKSHIDGGLAS